MSLQRIRGVGKTNFVDRANEEERGKCADAEAEVAHVSELCNWIIDICKSKECSQEDCNIASIGEPISIIDHSISRLWICTQRIDDSHMCDLNKGPADVEQSWECDVPVLVGHWVDEVAGLVLCVYVLRWNEDSRKSRENNDCADYIPRHSLAPSCADPVTSKSSDWCHDSVCYLPGENTISSDCVAQPDDIVYIPREIQKPHACAHIVENVSN